MRKFDIYIICSFILIVWGLTGCSEESDKLNDNPPAEMQVSEEISQSAKTIAEEVPEVITEPTIAEVQEVITEPMITEVDWSDYFEKINGAAVIYDPTENCYQIYNQELALTRRSPCSTFKIISSLIALENGIIEPEDSTCT